MLSRRSSLLSFRVTLQITTLLLASPVYPQTPVAQPSSAPGTSTVSGRVVVDGKPVPGIHLALRRSRNGISDQSDGLTAETDSEGRFRFTALGAGAYELVPVNSAYAWSKGVFGGSAASVTVGENEQVANIEVSLRRGGVITGKVTDSEGDPVMERFVQIDAVDAPIGTAPVQYEMYFQTDDRGVYRYYGVPAGRYRVSCGDGPGSFMQGANNPNYPRTFHPNASDQERARIVEVTEGAEISSIDIRLNAPGKFFRLTGRVVDSETNRPAARSIIGGELSAGANAPPKQRATAMSQENGEFELTGLAPGSWTLTSQSGVGGPTGGSVGYSDPITIDLQDDVANVEIRVRKGATLSGIATIEGDANPANGPRLAGMRVAVRVDTPGGSMNRPRVSQITSDGSFTVDGINPGLANFVEIRAATDTRRFALIRVQLDGAPVGRGIQIEGSESIPGIQLIYALANSSISGQVKLLGSAVPSGAQLYVSARSSVGASPGGQSRTDARGGFVVDGLPPGVYEMNVFGITTDGKRVAGKVTKQTVSLGSDDKQVIILEYTVEP